MAFRVDITPSAERDLETILQWLQEQRAGETGWRWFLALEEAFHSLSEQAKRCGIAPETVLFPFEVRQLLYGKRPHVYRILFAIEGDVVNVLHVRHSRRRQPL